MALIDDWMPAYDVAADYATEVAAPVERVWAALRTVDFGRSPVVRALFALRSLPGLLAGRGRRRSLETSLDRLPASGFVLLDERPREELLLGLAGRFWKPTGGVVRVTPDEFRAFDRPGYALATWNFTAEARADGRTRLATETRVRCTDQASRRRFRRYWRLIGPFSGLIRVEMLRMVRREAESG